MARKPVGPTNWGKAPKANHDSEIHQAKHTQPHTVVTKPNGMGRVAGGPRSHRELPKPIIPTPVQKFYRKS